MALYKAPQYSIAYSVVENASPTDLVFLNGNLSTSRWWMPTVEELKKNFASTNRSGRMIFVELPGCGDSTEIQGHLDVNEIAEQYTNLLKSLKVNSACVIGHSAGGLLSCLLMAKAPEIFKKALLLDPVGAKGIQFDDSVLEKYEEMKTSKDLTAAIIGFTIHNCDIQSEFFKQVVVEDTFKAVNNVGSKMIQALRGFNCEPEIKKIQSDVTVLFGEHDILLPVADAQALTENISTSRFVRVPGAGHCLNVENPKVMAGYIQQYLVPGPISGHIA